MIDIYSTKQIRNIELTDIYCAMFQRFSVLKLDKVQVHQFFLVLNIGIYFNTLRARTVRYVWRFVE